MNKPYPGKARAGPQYKSLFGTLTRRVWGRPEKGHRQGHYTRGSLDKQGGFQSTRTLETVSLAAGDWALSTTEVSWACKKPGSISGLGLFSDS